MAAGDDAPNSFRDPYWTALASSTEQKLGLPAGLLASVVMKGEKSNADQVSEVGAKTPFQITPTTRNLVLKRDGIDAYLSPQNAAEVAGLVLKDGVNWAQKQTQDPAQVPALAAGYYHAGGDKANWGPKTDAYIMRVTDGQKPIQQAALSSDFSSWMAAHPAVPAPAAPSAAPGATPSTAPDALSEGFGKFLANGGGKPAASAPAAPEPDMAAGLTPLPILGNVGNAQALASMGSQMIGGAVGGIAGLGKLVSGAGPDAAADTVRQVADSLTYHPGSTQGQQTLAQANVPAELLAKAGDVAGGKITDVTGSPGLGAAANAGIQVLAPALLGKVGGGVVGAVDAVKRIPSLTPEAMALPELDPARAVIQNVTADPATAIPAQQAPIAAAAAQPAAAVPEAAPAPVPAAGDAVPAGSAVQDVAQVAKKAAEGSKGATQELADLSAPNQKTTAAADRLGIGDYLQSDHVTTNDGYRQVVGVLKSDPTSELALTEKQGLAKVAERASNLIDEVGGTTDLSSLDSSVKKRMETTHAQLKAAEDSLYDRVRETIPASSEAPATNALAFIDQRANDLGGVQNLTPMEKQIVAKLSPKDGATSAADSIVTQKGNWLSAATKEGQVGGTVKDGILRITHSEVAPEAQGKGLGTRLYRELIDEAHSRGLRVQSDVTVETPAVRVYDSLRKQGYGVDQLPGGGKIAASEAAPEGGLYGKGANSPVFEVTPGPSAKPTAGMKQPTYALLDDVRKDVGAAAKNGGPFSDADTGLAKKIYGLLSDDQGAAAEAAGASNLFAQAKAATVVRKGMENDLASLFGKNLDGSLISDVTGAMKAASAGDTSKLINVLRATPEALKQEVVASGLQTVFRNAATRGEINFTGYAKWFEGLLRNKQAYAAVMSNLPRAARKQLSDLYRVSKGISDSLNARVVTGLRSSVLEAMNAPDALASKMYKLAGSVGKGLAVDAIGGHGAGMATALFSALNRTKTVASKAIDAVLTSPEFVAAVRAAGTPKQPTAVAAMANAAPFRRFMRSVHQQNATGPWREQWISRALLPAPVANNRN